MTAGRTHPVIGRTRFTDGADRDGQGQCVVGPDGERVYGVRLLTPEAVGEAPLVARQKELGG